MKKYIKSFFMVEAKKIAKIIIIFLAISFLLLNIFSAFISYFLSGSFNFGYFIMADFVVSLMFLLIIAFIGFYFFEAILLFSKRRALSKVMKYFHKFLSEYLTHQKI